MRLNTQPPDGVAGAKAQNGFMDSHTDLRPDDHTVPDLESQKRRMLAGEPYDDLTTELIDARSLTVKMTDDYNASVGRPAGEREAILRRLLGSVGANAFLEPTFRCEFGFHITIGDDFFANFDCILLDGGGITIGDNVLFGPRVSVYTTNHSLDPEERRAGACYARPVRICDNVWVGGGVTINPGVTIGENAVIGSGSVVTKDVPASTLAAGVPARVIRTITDQDRIGFRKEGW